MQPNDTPSVKRCGRCTEVKPVDQFYRLKSGYLHGYCRPCVTESCREWRRANRDKVLEVERRRRVKDAERIAEQTRQWRADHPETTLAAIRRWEAKNPDRIRMVRRAMDAVQRALKRGDLSRPAICEACGAQHRQITAAHHDYSRPLDVRWLCRPCHGRWDQAEPKTLHLG
jgi:hypothetical protein